MHVTEPQVVEISRCLFFLEQQTSSWDSAERLKARRLVTTLAVSVCQGELRHQARHNSAACLCHCPRSASRKRSHEASAVGLFLRYGASPRFQPDWVTRNFEGNYLLLAGRVPTAAVRHETFPPHPEEALVEICKALSFVAA